jgi:LysM repeat protein
MRQHASRGLIPAADSVRVARRPPIAAPASPLRATSPIGRGQDLSGVPVRNHPPVQIQAKLTVGHSNDPLEREADANADAVLSSRNPPSRTGGRCGSAALPALSIAASAASMAPPEPVSDALSTPGRPVDPAARAYLEPRLGRDFRDVRIHTDAKAAQSAHALGAEAYTAGHHAVFAPGRYRPESAAGLRLLAHELTHVVQQAEGRSPAIQRYEAGEHSQFGQTGSELKSRINTAQAIYTVDKGETPEFIAKAFNVSVEDLLERNKDKVKLFPLKSDKKKMVPGFAVGENIEIPPVLNDAMKDALKQGELTYKAGKADAAGDRATVRYGQGIAMGGDLYGRPDQIDNDSKSNIENIGKLIDKEETGSKKATKEWVDNADWDKATGGRFVDQALKNESHFSPSNPAFAPATHAGSPNNKTVWETNHGQALDTSKGGDKDKAFELNGFADHFLTDAFSAGHLINKLDTMEKFKSGVTIQGTAPMTKDSKLTSQSEAFFDQISAAAFPGDVAKLYSNYETVDTILGWHPNIDSVSAFSKLLQGIYKSEPDLIANSVAKAVHDDLNTKTGGIEVENNKGDTWPLSGDRTLNQKTLEVGRKAVAQSQYNVLSVFNAKDKIDKPALFKAVWDYVPRPTKAGASVVKTSVDSGTDIKSTTLVGSIVKMIKDNYKLILDALVKRGILKKA